MVAEAEGDTDEGDVMDNGTAKASGNTRLGLTVDAAEGSGDERATMAGGQDDAIRCRASWQAQADGREPARGRSDGAKPEAMEER